MDNFYRTNIIYRKFCKNPASDTLNLVVDVPLEGTSFEALGDIVFSEAELSKWLNRHQLLPDDYIIPYDPAQDNSAALSHTMQELKAFQAAKRTAAALSANADAFTLLSEACKVFLPVESAQEREQRLIRSGCPSFLVPMMDYVNELPNMVNGHSPAATNNIALAKILISIFADFSSARGDELAQKYGYEDKRSLPDYHMVINWWTTPKGRHELLMNFLESCTEIRSSLMFYVRRFIDRNPEFGSDAAGDWRNSLYAEERKTVGGKYDSVFSVLDELIVLVFQELKSSCTEPLDAYVKENIQLAFGDFINLRLKNVNLQLETLCGERVQVCTRVMDAAYLSLAENMQNGVQYRKCALCNRYFQVGSQKTRKYCDIHLDKNASKFYRMAMAAVDKKST